MYAEMETGATALAFAHEQRSEMHGIAIRVHRSGDTPAGVEICFVTDAVAQGAAPLKVSKAEPWGQIVGYVQELNGCLVEICSPVSP